MRELEFLPTWYSRLARRKQWLALQGWIVLVLLGGLGVWLVRSHLSIRTAEGSVRVLGNELENSRRQMQKLEDLLALQKQWRHQYEMLQALGPHVEAARVVSAVAELMPAQMSLLEINMDRSQTAARSVRVQRADTTSAASPVDVSQMRVHLQGVAPTDADVANFLAKLSDQPCFQAVSMTYAKDRIDSGHRMRQFEVSFSIPLGEP